MTPCQGRVRENIVGILGFPVGQRAATPEQITEALKVWQKASDKIQLVEYARSHEGRPLHYLVISSPENLAQVDNIKADLGKLANPVNLSNFGVYTIKFIGIKRDLNAN